MRRWRDAEAPPHASRCGAARLVVTLDSEQVAMLTSRHGAEVRCLAGELWITEPPGVRDTILFAGQAYAVARAARRVLLSSAAQRTPVTLQIAAPHAKHDVPRWPRRWRRPRFQLEVS